MNTMKACGNQSQSNVIFSVSPLNVYSSPQSMPMFVSIFATVMLPMQDVMCDGEVQ